MSPSLPTSISAAICDNCISTTAMWQCARQLARTVNSSLVKDMPGQPIPKQYVLQGESLDNLSDLLFARRALRPWGRIMPDGSKSVALGRQYFGKLQDHSGVLPTEVTKRRIAGKRAAKAYRKQKK